MWRLSGKTNWTRDREVAISNPSSSSSFFFFFFVPLCPLLEIQVALPELGTAAARAALPIPISVCSVFLCPDIGMAVSVWDF